MAAYDLAVRGGLMETGAGGFGPVRGGISIREGRIAARLDSGLSAPECHARARPPVVEREATHRAIALAGMPDRPIRIFHVSGGEAAETARAQARGVRVWGETCPHYRVLTEADMDRPGFEGAKFMGSPAPRKGAIAIGADADLAPWEPANRVTPTDALMRHAIGDTPHEGMRVTGWPVATPRHGQVVMRDVQDLAGPGSGQSLPRAPDDFTLPRGVVPHGFDAAPRLQPPVPG